MRKLRIERKLKYDDSFKSPSKVIFIDDQLENAFNSLPDSDSIKKALVRAIQTSKIFRFLWLKNFRRNF